MKKRVIQFGAGNIGRSFIGQLFSSAGYEVVFVDINEKVIQELNRRRGYEVVIKQNDAEDEILHVKDVRAIHASQTEAVIREIMEAELIVTSVGKQALRHIMPTIAAGILNRFTRPNAPVLNIILAENMLEGNRVVTQLLSEELGTSSFLLRKVGIIETSIGKMVPIMPREITEKDPLLVYGEPYSTLIIDARAFLGPLPEIDGLKAVDPIEAYVDRKLFIHNLGHAALAYIGFKTHPSKTYLYEVIEDPAIALQVRSCMQQAATALERLYPEVFTHKQLDEHIEDLLHRFSNRALKDTIYRVGKDLGRKLHITDRVLGAMKLCIRFDLPFDRIAEVFNAALGFKASDQEGVRFPADVEFINKAQSQPIEELLKTECGLEDSKLLAQVVRQLR